MYSTGEFNLFAQLDDVLRKSRPVERMNSAAQQIACCPTMQSGRKGVTI
jgi:hypothetical protein